MNHIIRKTILAALLAATTTLQATAQDNRNPQDSTLLAHMDSVEISLLTAGPGNQVWSLYGHTAIRYQDRAAGQDLAVNYGMFSFEKSFFIARFVLGLTDYEMGISSMEHFMSVYSREGRWVYQQDLNLTREEKLQVTNALNENSLPENRVYRYNYFYNNCTTKARDILMESTNLSAYLPDNKDIKPTYRQMVHEWTNGHQWTRFGNDLLLGIGADQPTSFAAREFLPDSLRKDFDNTTIAKTGEAGRKLVSHGVYLIPPTPSSDTAQHSPSSFQLSSPTTVFALFLLLTVVLTLMARHRKRTLWVFDMLLLLITGLAGVILFIMIFSEHPTVRVNLQILLLNPLSLVFALPAALRERKGRRHWYWKVLTVSIFLFLIGAFFQDYAEGMILLAFALLMRCLLPCVRHGKA